MPLCVCYLYFNQLQTHLLSYKLTCSATLVSIDRNSTCPAAQLPGLSSSSVDLILGLTLQLQYKSFLSLHLHARTNLAL